MWLAASSCVTVLQAHTQTLGPAVSVALTLEEDFCGKDSCSTNAK